MIKKIIFLTSLISIFTFSSSFASEKKSFKDITFGCYEKGDYIKIVPLILNKDAMGILSFVKSGKCVKFLQGKSVNVESVAADGLAKVTPEGSSKSLWTAANLLGAPTTADGALKSLGGFF